MNIIHGFHTETSHGGEKKTYKNLSDLHASISGSLIQQYIKRSERCTETRQRPETASGVVVRPPPVNDLNERGQVDIVDMQTMKDGGYRFILHYTDFFLLNFMLSAH